MSTADSSKAAVWLTGDGYRGPAGAVRPPDPFAASPQTGDATPVVLTPFGGIKTGFANTPSQDTTDYTVWNYRDAPYLSEKGPRTDLFVFIAVDYSSATVATLLRGGTITETPASSGLYVWTYGDDEDFSLLLRGVYKTKQRAFWIERATLNKPVPENLNADDIDGFEFEIKALAPASGGQPVEPITNWNPLA